MKYLFEKLWTRFGIRIYLDFKATSCHKVSNYVKYKWNPKCTKTVEANFHYLCVKNYKNSKKNGKVLKSVIQVFPP